MHGNSHLHNLILAQLNAFMIQGRLALIGMITFPEGITTQIVWFKEMPAHNMHIHAYAV